MRESPLKVNLKNDFSKTALGRVYFGISDAAHFGFYRFASYFAYKWTLYRFRRQFFCFGAFFGSMWFGYLFSGFGKVLYPFGYF